MDRSFKAALALSIVLHLLVFAVLIPPWQTLTIPSLGSLPSSARRIEVIPVESGEWFLPSTLTLAAARGEQFGGPAAGAERRPAAPRPAERAPVPVPDSASRVVLAPPTTPVALPAPAGERPVSPASVDVPDGEAPRSPAPDGLGLARPDLAGPLAADSSPAVPPARGLLVADPAPDVTAASALPVADPAPAVAAVNGTGSEGSALADPRLAGPALPAPVPALGRRPAVPPDAAIPGVPVAAANPAASAAALSSTAPAAVAAAGTAVTPAAPVPPVDVPNAEPARLAPALSAGAGVPVAVPAAVHTAPRMPQRDPRPPEAASVQAVYPQPVLEGALPARWEDPGLSVTREQEHVLPPHRSGLEVDSRRAETAFDVGVVGDDKARLAPTLRTYVPPRYPPELRGSGAEGRVVVRIRVDTEGKVVGWEIANVEGHPAFGEAVAEVVPRWRFYVHPAWSLSGQAPPAFTVQEVFREGEGG